LIIGGFVIPNEFKIPVLAEEGEGVDEAGKEVTRDPGQNVPQIIVNEGP
jgi:hypothetical protein